MHVWKRKKKKIRRNQLQNVRDILYPLDIWHLSATQLIYYTFCLGHGRRGVQEYPSLIFHSEPQSRENGTNGIMAPSWICQCGVFVTRVIRNFHFHTRIPISISPEVPSKFLLIIIFRYIFLCSTLSSKSIEDLPTHKYIIEWILLYTGCKKKY